MENFSLELIHEEVIELRQEMDFNRCFLEEKNFPYLPKFRAHFTILTKILAKFSVVIPFETGKIDQK